MKQVIQFDITVARMFILTYYLLLYEMKVCSFIYAVIHLVTTMYCCLNYLLYT